MVINIWKDTNTLHQVIRENGQLKPQWVFSHAEWEHTLSKSTPKMTKCWGGRGEKGNPYTAVEMQTGTAKLAGEQFGWFLKKLGT